MLYREKIEKLMDEITQIKSKLEELKKIVEYTEYKENGEERKTIILENKDSISSKNSTNENINLIKADDDIVQVGDLKSNLNLVGNKVLTNYKEIATKDNTVTLDEEQLINPKKVFGQLFVKQTPSEDLQVVNLSFVKSYIKDFVQTFAKRKLRANVKYYISENGNDNNDGSKDKPFRTFKKCLSTIAKLDCNLKKVSIHFLTDYSDEDTLHILFKHNADSAISVINSEHSVMLSPIKCNEGHWYFENVIIRNTKEFKECVNVSLSGIVSLNNGNFEVFYNDSIESNVISISDKGFVFMNGEIDFINHTSIPLKSAVNITNNAVCRVEQESQLNIKNENGGFYSAIECDCNGSFIVSQISKIALGENTKQFRIKNNSSLGYKVSFSGGVDGESDLTSTLF